MQSQGSDLLQILINGAEGCVVLLNPQGHVVAINEQALRALQTTTAQALGQAVWTLPWWPGSGELSDWQRRACSLAAAGDKQHRVFSFSPGAGRALTLDCVIKPLLDAAGEVCNLVVSLCEVQRPAAAEIGAAQLWYPAAPGDARDGAAHLLPQALAEGDLSFRLMVESIEEYAMFMVDLRGMITSWNRGAERLTGYSENEAVGRHFSMLYPRDSLDERHAEHELATARERGRYEEEGMRVRKDGSQYHAQIIVWRIDDSAGNTVGFAKITRDITALKHAQRREAQLLESETRFRLMVESIDDYAMFMVDPRGLITSWNRGAERLTGYAEAEAIGRHFSMLYPRDELSEAHAAFELAMARRYGRHEEEGLRVRKDGSVYHAQISIWPVEDRRGDIIGFAKITRDVTVRRQAEQALRDSEAKFRTITNAMPQMVWSASPAGVHDYSNEQWYRFTGVTDSDSDRPWLELVHPEDQAHAREAWQHSLASGETFEIRYRLRHSSGGFRWVLGRALPVRNERGEIVRWMGTHTDIHEQKQAEEAMQEAGRRKDDFMAMLAHELRNPLAPVRNSTQLIRKLMPPDARLTRGLDVIERQTGHMSRLIDDLLDVARISRGKIELRKEPVELGAIVRQTVEDFRSDFDAKQVRLLLHITAQPLHIQADATRIAQALGNLLHNAAKFTEPGDQVEVTLREDESGETHNAVITVADTGIGIEPALTEQLFTPFTQANQDLARSHGGLGLGLALIKGLVELHGGRVAASSRGLGQGAEFTICLPLSRAHKPQRRPQRTVGPVAALAIVLIDDNRDMVETLQVLLTMDGHEVFSAYDGEQGLRLIRERQPDLVLCDIGLPGGRDGYAVARDVRAEGAIANTFMVALSGYGQAQDRQQAMASGFDRHLLKPLDFDQLRQVLATAHQRRQAAPFRRDGNGGAHG